MYNMCLVGGPRFGERRCVHEVAINATDVCVGDFWATAERAAYMAPHATFSQQLTDAKFYLATTREEKNRKEQFSFSNPLSPTTCRPQLGPDVVPWT